MTKHFSEADLLETYYTQPGESMPVMMHLANCHDCAARYERLEQKLRQAAACNTEKPTTFWSRQRLQIMRRVQAQPARVTSVHPLRIAAAAVLAFFLGGAVVYETVRPAPQPAQASKAASPVVAPAAPPDSEAHDAWQSDELKDFHNVVEWEAWVPENKTNAKEGSSL